MEPISNRSELAAVLLAMPQSELVGVLNDVFSRRVADVVSPDIEEAKLIVAGAYRARDIDVQTPAWEILVLASPAEKGTFVTDIAPTQEGSCCGVTLVAYAKDVLCPLCGRRTGLT